MAPPVGIEIRQGSAKFKVGRQIGNGACATVYQLNDASGAATEYAVKCAPIPTKTTKKGNSAPEKNANLLNYEKLVYQTQFIGLQGKYIPFVPKSKGPPVFVDESGKPIQNYGRSFVSRSHNSFAH
jgi:hypothetical protein